MCFGSDPASAMVPKQTTRNIYLQTDDKRCRAAETATPMKGGEEKLLKASE